jgi:flagellar biogenesis protein FliO
MRIQEDKNKNEERRKGSSYLFRPMAVGFTPNGLWRELHRLWQRVLRLGHRPPKRLRLCESLPLGERRFVAVVEFDRERFLVGGTAASMVLLSRLADGRAEEEQRERARQNPELAVAKNAQGNRW